SAHSGKRRFYLLNMASGAVDQYVVAHGIGSDPNDTGYATRFSDKDGSYMSSLGFVLTGDTYDGKHGYSLLLDGLSSTNEHMRDRSIVMHTASYVQPGKSPEGRSEGCFVLTPKDKDHVVNLVKEGSLLYADLSKSKAPSDPL